ncbi:MAG: DNA-processing protein DprA [Thermoanaerobaculia bacterium]|nr:DNA-processing protein DprA [Thermoanaerobaculia bacterium]
MNPSDRRSLLIALNCSPNIARGHICRLAQALGTSWHPRAQADKATAENIGVPVGSLRKALCLAGDAPRTAEREIARAHRRRVKIITIEDASYPPELHQAPLPPPVLYVFGSIPSAPAIAIVGSRKPNAYGRESAHFFGRHLALRGVTVVSGFARGVDEAAHRGVLSTDQGLTVAVLGCGVDVSYPSHREALVEQVRQRGALVSEFPMGTQPWPRNFPVRNRIIAALAQSTLVIQAAPRSGSLITARYALEMGRDVFALPGRIFEETSLGPNALIRDGAGIALHPDDLLPASWASAPSSEPEDVVEASPPLGDLPLRIWKDLERGDELGVDALVAMLGVGADRILSALLELELGGWIQRLPGPIYARRHR